MRLTDRTIAAIKDRIDITEVVSRSVTLKRNAACCPFHDERTPSFHVHPAKNIFKCFGCGEGGDAIAFIMKHEKIDYGEAMKLLAEMYNVALEYDEHYDPVKDQDKKDAVAELRAVVKFVSDKYSKELQTATPALEYLAKRRITPEVIGEWNLGFAPDDFRFITPSLVNMGKLKAAVEAGISVSKEGRNYDFYRNRITIPILDVKGNMAGLAGRIMPGNNGTAKYFNSVESPIYHKSEIWFGLYQAITAKIFKQVDYVYIVEGYFDVIAMHETGCINTVAACGTAISEDHVKLLKRYVKHVVLMLDGDDAGKSKSMKHIDLFLRLGCKIEIVELPDGNDPAEYIGAMNPVPEEEFENELMKN